MFRGSMPALTLCVFTIGVGIGLSWSWGLIPLRYVPANGGSLTVDPSRQEPLPPPNEPSLKMTRRERRPAEPIPDDPEVFESQSEPENDGSESTIAQARTRDESARSKLIRTASAASELSISDDSTDEWAAEPARPRERFRPQPKPKATQQVAVEEPVRKKPLRQVTVANHEVRETPSENRETSDDSKSAELSPREQLAIAEGKLAAGETLAAHRELSKLYWNHKDLRPELQETIESTAKSIFFQSKPNYIEPYVIQEGERLEVIAKKYQLSWEYLAKLNRTDPRRIQIGQKLKVMKGPFGAVVDLKEFALTVHLQGYFVKRYSVGIGKDGSSPVGKFAVLNKVENPPYTAPNGKVIAADDPSNPLGERWIDLGDSYGIHGTIDPSSIGKAESRGCIRLRDNDIIEVYDFLVKGSEVVIRK